MATPSVPATTLSAGVDRGVDLLEGFLRGELGTVGTIPLHEPTLGEREWRHVKAAIESGWVSSAGAEVERFERLAAEACGAAYGVATVNGTAALEMALRLAGVEAGDLVVCPALTFIGTANAISHIGAAPLFADCEAQSVGLDAAKLATFLATCRRTTKGPIHPDSGRRIAAIVPVHIFGHAADMDALLAVAEKHAVPLVEDAAEALGTAYRGRPVGALGRIGALSFNGNKVVTTGGGGMILTNDRTLADRARHLTTTARVADRLRFDHDEIGYNYRMPNLNAALGCGQMEGLDEFIEKKRALAARYEALFADCDGVTVLREPEWGRSNYWLNTLLLPDEASRDRFVAAADARGIGVRPCWRLLPDTGAYRDAACADSLTTARDLAARTVNIPSSPSLMGKAENA